MVVDEATLPSPPGGGRPCTLGSAQGPKEEGIQQQGSGVNLPDVLLHVYWLREPVCGGDVQAGCRVADQQEVDDRWRHRDVS